MQNTVPVRYETDDFICGYDNEPVFSGSISPHMHNCWEVLFIKEGLLTYTVDGNTFDIAPGSLIISPPGVVHALYAKGSIHYERYSLIVWRNPFINGIAGQIPPQLHVLNVSDNKMITDLFDKLGFYFSKLPEAYLGTALRSLANEVWIHIHLSTKDASQSVVFHSNTVVAKSVSFIKEHIREPITVKQICDALFITPSYLHQCFGKHMSITPKKYIMVQKLQLVQQALMNEENPTEICRRYGFRSYSTFYRNYQTIYGCKPSAKPSQALQKIDL